MSSRTKKRPLTVRLYAGVAAAAFLLLIGVVLGFAMLAYLPFPESPRDGKALSWLCLGTTLCLLLAAVSFVTALWRPAAAQSLCVKCGYDPAGLGIDATCPECGT